MNERDIYRFLTSPSMTGQTWRDAYFEECRRSYMLGLDAKEYRLVVGMILLSNGGTIKITRKAQEDIDVNDSIEPVTEMDGTMVLTYRRAALKEEGG